MVKTTYIIVMRRNPYFHGSGDFVLTTESEAYFRGTLEDLRANTRLPDLDDDALYSAGYPGYAYLRIEAYEARQVNV